MNGQPKTGADAIAEALSDLSVELIFAITGAGNLAICDAIHRLGKSRMIFVHHEQAAVMAAQSLARTTGKLGVALVTTGGGSTNALTGIVGAHMDSVPVLLLSGNESSIHTNSDNELRIWGVQGFDSRKVFEPVSKQSHRVRSADFAYDLVLSSAMQALTPRQGIVTIDIPMDLQRKALTSPRDSQKKANALAALSRSMDYSSSLNLGVKNALIEIGKSKRPVVILGAGLKPGIDRASLRNLTKKLGIPVLLSWSGIDLLDSAHPLNFGRSGIYGDRYSNMILQQADFVLAIGSRLAIPQMSYDPHDFARNARVMVVDIDENELTKFTGDRWLPVQCDASEFVKSLSGVSKQLDIQAWIQRCEYLKLQFPRREQTSSAMPPGNQAEYVNSYDVVYEISDQSGDNDIFVTDMGTGLLSGFYGIDVRANQQLSTSLGLGEMGYGLPAAVGAQFANPDKRIICLNADGGMMMNLQELQTVSHHKLPIKLVVFNNDGYLMIKHSQNNLFDGRFVGSDNDSGVSCPDFEGLAALFGLSYVKIDGASNISDQVSTFLNTDGPVLLDVFMHPEQLFIPRVGTLKGENGSFLSPPLEDMIPLIDAAELTTAMGGYIHPQSEAVRITGGLPISRGNGS